MKNEPVKVLYFVDRMLRGGIQSLVIDWVSRFDKEKIHVDFLLLDDGIEYELEQTLRDIGCEVYKLKGVWIRKPKDFFDYRKALDNFFLNHHDYKVVHMHSSSKNYSVLEFAKKYGVSIRIAHSHNIDFQTKNKIKKYIGDIFKIPLKYYSTDYFACSKLAGEWLFGDKIVNSNKFKIIHNAIDYDKFKYSEEIRNKIRKELEINNDEIIIGHVGRFTNQKNHDFLIDIFYECYKQNVKYKLLLVGTGELEDKIKEKVNNYGITKNVIFLGFKNNVGDYMQAMDYFLMPSLYEGLGLVLIEAQASGLYCFTSKDVVPEETHITDHISYISLEDSANNWANKIVKTNYKRTDSYDSIVSHGYFIDQVVNQLKNFYLGDTSEED